MPGMLLPRTLMPGRGSTSTNATRTKRAGHGHACRMHMNTPSVYYPVHTRPQQQPEEHQLSTSSSTTELLDLTHARLSLERLWNLSELWTQGNAAFSFAPGSSNMVRDTLSMGNVLLVQLEDRPKEGKQDKRNPDYFANVGDAIRTLREDIPLLFQQDLNYDIYREDIVFRDPRNCFKGMKNYRTIFWSLQFHGRIFFSRLYVDVKRIWQPTDGVICMRWTVHGIPRVPWEAEGTFDGISTYRLDNTGKIYEHSVDNVLLRDPPMQTNPPLLAGLNLVPTGQGQTPVPGLFQAPEHEAELATQTMSSSSSGGCSSASLSSQIVTGYGSINWAQALIERLSWVQMYAGLNETVQRMAAKSLVKAALE